MGIFQQFPYSNFHEMNLDEIIKIVKELQTAWAAYQAQWSDLYTNTADALEDFKTFAYNYFDTLDLSAETTAVLNKMIADGTIDPVITDNLSPVVTSWLEDNITISPGVTIDASLSVAGAAADAAATGEVKLGVDNVISSETLIFSKASTSGFTLQAPYILSSTGDLVAISGDAQYQTTVKIPVEYGNYVYFRIARAQYGNQWYSFMDANDTVISHSGRTAADPNNLYNQLVKVPFKAKFFVLSYDAHGMNANEQTPDVHVIEKYNKTVKTSPVKINAGASAWSGTQISGTINQFNVITNNAFNIHLAETEEFSHFYTGTFDVSDCDYIKLNNYKAMYGNLLWAILDSAGIVLADHANADYVAGSSMIIKVPEGAATILLSGYDSTPEVYKITDLTITNAGSLSIDWSALKWAVIGDSITEVNARATKRYMDYIKDSTGIDYVNLGVSGTGFMNGGGASDPYYSRVSSIPLDSDIITIMGSGNDCSLTLGSPTDSGTSTVCGCINKTIDDIRTRIVGANIAIIAPTPWVQYPTYTSGNAMALYCDALKQICALKGVPYLDLYRCSNMLPWEASFRNAYYSKDGGNGVHPDENGHKFFAPHIYALMRSVLMI